MRIACVLVVATVLGSAAPAPAADWPSGRQYLLGETGPAFSLSSEDPNAVAVAQDGAVLWLANWRTERQLGPGVIQNVDRIRLLRIARDGSRQVLPGATHPARQFPEQTLRPRDFLPLPGGTVVYGGEGVIASTGPAGRTVRVAGTGRYGFGGDGGPAKDALVSTPVGLRRLSDGSLVFADSGNHRVRRIGPDGRITTIAGSGAFGFGGDGGPATEAALRFPADVLPTARGGLLVADEFNGRVREVSADGIIRTIAGIGPRDDGELDYESAGDGGPAGAARLAMPHDLAFMPDGDLLIAERASVRRVDADGTIDTIFRVPGRVGARVGDFAGRTGTVVHDVAATPEGGVAVTVQAVRGERLFLLAPERARRAMVTLRGAHVSGRRIAVTVDTTRAGTARLDVHRAGRLVARAQRRVRAGRRRIALRGRFGADLHRVRVTVQGAGGPVGRDGVSLLTSTVLPEAVLAEGIGDVLERCRRFGPRRVDCAVHVPEDEEDGPCLRLAAYRLAASGVVFERPYGEGCRRRPGPFERAPAWTGLWRAWPDGEHG
jgi:hypothetical protein